MQSAGENDEQNDADKLENGEDSAISTTDTNGGINGDDNESVDEHSRDDVDADADADVSDEWTNKRIKLQMPTFLKPKSVATWKSIAVDDPERAKRLGIESICPNICLYFLHDACVEGDNCYNSHELPSDVDVLQHFKACGTTDTGKLLRVIIARCPKLLYTYFRVFVDYFADHQMKEHLIRAFIRSGETYESAMEAILFNLKYIDRDTIDILLNMNLIEGISVSDFLNVFRSLNRHRYRFNEHIINRLMYLCTQSEDVLDTDTLSDFTQLIFHIIKTNRHVQSVLNKNDYRKYIQLYNRYRSHSRNQNRNGTRRQAN
ncbi:uncharacterized protein LOC116344674 isoform X2 [Contarinia nasturtii]|uniref:uncharacterized protein LOC116344674 isoform X2 n=1 Tax=Contarinia nasturtii TaxID=265458 RepID=UPI0012D474B9|nr:uncharacterized protein LOC116344674 isoform X2 [Contarinia nasturtii]